MHLNYDESAGCVYRTVTLIILFSQYLRNVKIPCGKGRRFAAFTLFPVSNYYHTKILEVNLFAFACRLFHEDFSPIDGALHDTQPFSSFMYINLEGFLNVIPLLIITFDE